MSARFRVEGDVVLAREENGAEYRVAVVAKDGKLRMARGRSWLRSEVERSLKGSGTTVSFRPGGAREEDAMESLGEDASSRNDAVVPLRGESPPCPEMDPRAGGSRNDAVVPLRGESPPCPEMDPRAGDKTPEVVAWFFRYRPEEAELRYKGRKFAMPEG